MSGDRASDVISSEHRHRAASARKRGGGAREHWLPRRPAPRRASHAVSTGIVTILQSAQSRAVASDEREVVGMGRTKRSSKRQENRRVGEFWYAFLPLFACIR